MAVFKAAMLSPRKMKSGALDRSWSYPSPPHDSRRTSAASDYMKLLAIAGRMDILATLGLTGTFHSDCKGLILKLHHPHAPTAQHDGHRLPTSPLLHHSTTTPPIKLSWTRSHPERSTISPSGWDHKQCGIFLADRFAGLPTPPDRTLRPNLP